VGGEYRRTPGQHSLVAPNDGEYDPSLSASGFDEGNDKGTFHKGTWAGEAYQVFPLIGATFLRTRMFALARRPQADALPDSD
jgi:hypothetical protein